MHPFDSIGGHYSLQTASDIWSDHIFEIYSPNHICYHVCLGCLSLCSFVGRKKIKKKLSRPLLDLLGFVAVNNWGEPQWQAHTAGLRWTSPSSISYPHLLSQVVSYFSVYSKYWVFYPGLLQHKSCSRSKYKVSDHLLRCTGGLPYWTKCHLHRYKIFICPLINCLDQPFGSDIYYT